MDPNNYIWVWFPFLPFPLPFQMGHQHQYHRPNPGPIPQYHSRHTMTEASTRQNISHISSGMIASDRSTGTYPVHARMGANNDTGIGGARSPSRNLRMVGRGSTNEKRKKPYDRQRSGPSQTKRGKEDLSAYQVPIMEPEGMLVSQSIHLLSTFTTLCSSIPATIPAPIPAPASAPAPLTALTSAVPMPTAVSTPLAEVRQRGLGGNTKNKVRKRKVYDYDSDVHRVSSGSETDSD
ncbi:hypothetical protein BYT27DRAFT_7194526 [Phlegmacium glaucopus]|nr:hypothetical protein BYT27DRAFT_7194526 [Phlegmacium glaucopus]